jgi:transcriptional regulator with XRE-family HTH domain
LSHANIAVNSFLMNIKAVFGANIKYYRKKRGLSQEQLAEMSDITPKHLSAIETGAAFVSAGLLEKLSRGLKVSASVLFYSAGEKSMDDTLFNFVEQIVEKELLKAIELIKLQIRRIEDPPKNKGPNNKPDKTQEPQLRSRKTRGSSKN